MNIQRPTMINLEREAVENSKARHVRVSLAETTRISTRDARAHSMLGGLQPGQSIHIASMGELSMHDAAAAIVEHYGPFDVLTLATWAASEESIKRIAGLRQAGGVRRIEALVDSRCPVDCAEAHALMRRGNDAVTGRAQCLGEVCQRHARGGNVVDQQHFWPGNLPAVQRVGLAIVRGHRDWIREVLNAA